ncbi:lamin tail domain-containing protein [bacterium]|nr:lamin tail domain-containing protein [bacterium]
MRILESKNFFKLIFFLLFIFLIPNFSKAYSDVRFNEIAWMGTASSSHSEWLEFFNFGTSSVDISPWSVYGADTGECINFSEADGTSSVNILSSDYLIYANAENIFPNLEIDIWDATIGLNNRVPGNLKLVNQFDCEGGVGVIIDEINNTEEWIAGEAENYKTMERFNLDTWKTSLVSGGTPGEENSITDFDEDNYEEDEEDEQEGDNYVGIDSSSVSYSSNSNNKLSYEAGDVLINEVVSDPKEGEEEWVELKLNYNFQVDLDDWTIEEGSGSQTALEGVLGSGNDFIVISNLKGNLNNKGDIIILKDANGNIIDQMSYGDNNPEVDCPADPFSLSRDNGENWYITKNVTKGKENIIELPEQESSKSVKKESVVINEIFPNPKGDDHEREFIELYNKSEEDIDLTNWRIENKSGRLFRFGLYDDNIKIPSKGYFTLFRKESYIPLNNNDDEIKLFSPDKESPVQVLSYNNANEGLSYLDTENIDIEKITTSTLLFFQNSTRIGEWVWSEFVTPGRNNNIKTVNRPPEVSFSYSSPVYSKENIFFDSSDSFDENGDSLKFKWDFGDNVVLNLDFPNHVFLEPGKYPVKLSVSDGLSTNSKIKLVEVLDKNGEEKKTYQEEDVLLNEEKNEKNNKVTIEEEKESNFISEDEGLYSSYKLVSLDDIKNCPEGMSVLTRGKVAVEPGVLASQYFYIVGSPGIQVYNYFKDFPDLKVGDYIQVKGEITVSRGEMRIKTKINEDVVIIESQSEPIPINLKCSQIGEEHVGSLVSLEGVITERKSNKFYLDDDTDEVLVYVQEGTGIDIKILNEGNAIKLTGIVNNYDGLIRLMPRSLDDVGISKDGSDQNINTEKSEARVLGEKASSSLILPSRNSKINLEIYVIIISLIIISIIVFYSFLKRE